MTQYAISEVFTSLQGEGYWAGTPMRFVRFAGCPVGGPTGVCTDWRGKQFTCDTGPKHPPVSGIEWHPYTEITQRLAPDMLHTLANTHDHICLTGGEPLALDLVPFLDGFDHDETEDRGPLIHIETSGTVPPNMDITHRANVWITLSPKHEWDRKWLAWANEMKILVDTETTHEQLTELLGHWVNTRNLVFLQPIQDTKWKQNTQHAVKLCHALGARLSLQTHKLLSIR